MLLPSYTDYVYLYCRLCVIHLYCVCNISILCVECFLGEKQQLTDQIASLNLQIASLQEQAKDGESKEKQLAELQISLETYMSEKKSLESGKYLVTCKLCWLWLQCDYRQL